MSGKKDQIQGRAKEAAGALADDDELRREGKIDQAAGKVKEGAQTVADKAQEAAKKLNRG
ncbi:MAG: CsbD family protein [Pirellulales bacterium]